MSKKVKTNSEMKNSFIVFTILLLSLSFSLLFYLGIGYSDTNEYSTLIYRLLDDDYLKNDWYVNANSDTINVRYYYNYLVYFLNSLIQSIPTVYFLLYFLNILILSTATYLISLHFFKDKKASLFNSFLILAGGAFTLGGNLIVHRVIISFGLAFSISLIGFYFLLKRRLILFSIMTGIATSLHFLWGHLIFGILILASFLTNLKKSNNLKNHLKSLMVFLLFTLAISPILYSNSQLGLSLTAEKVAEIYGYFRIPHHIMPFQWELHKYIEFIFFFSLFVIAFKNLKIEKINKRLIKIIIGIIFIFFVVGTIFTEIAPVSLIIKLQLFRTSTFFVFIEYLFIGAYIYQESKKSVEKEELVRLFTLAALTISFFYGALLLIVFPIFIALEYLRKNENKKPTYFLLLLLSVGLIVFLLFYNQIMSFLNQKIDMLILTALKTLIFIPIFATLINNKKTLKILMVFSILISSIFFFAYKPLLVYPYDPATEEMYDFIMASTPNEAIFLIPPHIETFRLGANRAIVVDFKANPFGEKIMVNWYERITDISKISNYSKEQKAKDLMKSGYSSLSEEEILTLKNKYTFSYAVFEKPKELEFHKVFDNEKYILYQIDYE